MKKVFFSALSILLFGNIVNSRLSAQAGNNDPQVNSANYKHPNKAKAAKASDNREITSVQAANNNADYKHASKNDKTIKPQLKTANGKTKSNYKKQL